MIQHVWRPPAGWFGYRWVRHETVQEYFARRGGEPGAAYETVHQKSVAHNPLPCNVASRDDLPDTRGWWGYSFRDVPERTSDETIIATIPDGLITWYRDPDKGHDFYPAILTGARWALSARELRFRPRHTKTLRRAPRPARLRRATWIIERVYHNHSHWLTAHLPKLLLLRERGELQHVLLPPERTPAIDGSLRLLGMNPESFPTFDPARPLRVDTLTVVVTDRFRPELIRLVPKAYGVLDAPVPRRKIYISRAGASRRRLLNEEQIWSVLEPAGFEQVRMETLTLEEQVALMRQTAVLVAPHGAGLTNMMFCPPGAHVIEFADLSFPNPNFYALAAALGHRYWVVAAESFGECHPLEKDLRVPAEAVMKLLPCLEMS